MRYTNTRRPRITPEGLRYDDPAMEPDRVPLERVHRRTGALAALQGSVLDPQRYERCGAPSPSNRSQA